MTAEEKIRMGIAIEDTAVDHRVGKGIRGEAETEREVDGTEETLEMGDTMIGEEGGEMTNLAEQGGEVKEVRLILLVLILLIDLSLTIFKRLYEIREIRANVLGIRDEAVVHGARTTKERKRRGREIGRD